MSKLHSMAEDTELGECITVFLECGQVVIFLDGETVGVEIQTLKGVSLQGVHTTLEELRTRHTP